MTSLNSPTSDTTASCRWSRPAQCCEAWNGLAPAITTTFTTPKIMAPITRYLAACESSKHGVIRAKTGNTNAITVTGLTPGKTYRCIVKATNGR
ncbi:MAG: fibronectin type III domain-containing protein [Acidimicrobiia bacterium]